MNSIQFRHEWRTTRAPNRQADGRAEWRTNRCRKRRPDSDISMTAVSGWFRQRRPAGVCALRRAAKVPPVFGEIEDVAVGEPCQRVGQLIAFALRCADRHQKAMLDPLDNGALKATDIVHVGYNLFARLTTERAHEHRIARRYLDELAGALAAVGEHAATEQADLDALIAAPVALRQPNRLLCLQSRHGNPNAARNLDGLLLYSPEAMRLSLKIGKRSTCRRPPVNAPVDQSEMPVTPQNGGERVAWTGLHGGSYREPPGGARRKGTGLNKATAKPRARMRLVSHGLRCVPSIQLPRPCQRQPQAAGAAFQRRESAADVSPVTPRPAGRVDRHLSELALGVFTIVNVQNVRKLSSVKSLP